MRSTLLALALVGAVTPALAQAADACIARSGAQVVPLVELYTSEGCSSCPPADRWLSQHYNDDNANFLAFHVDYWDSIGWPDRFASHAYTVRQRSRVGAQGGSTVYTPQVMVGSEVRTSWRSGWAWRGAVRDARQPAGAALALRLRPQGNGWQAALGAAPTEHAGQGAQVWLARYVDNQTTAVKAGENRGVTLRHDRVVRELYGPWKLGSESISEKIDLPAEAASWGLTAFVQGPKGDVLQSLALNPAQCKL